MMRTIFSALRGFKRDTSGMMIVEAVIILPALVWTFIAFSVFWDAYRTINQAQKATFALADVISRERAQISSSYARSYARIFAYVAEVPGNLNAISFTSGPMVVRVTSASYTQGATPSDPGTLARMWSMSSDTARMPLHTDASLASIINKIPVMLDGDSIVIVETRLRWQPKVTGSAVAGLVGGRTSAWLTTRDIDTFTTVRPRFVPKLCFLGTGMTVACDL